MSFLEEDTTTVKINGQTITGFESETITCTFGPDATTGEYSTSQVTLVEYELICKNTIEGFCNCNVDDTLTDS